MTNRFRFLWWVFLGPVVLLPAAARGAFNGSLTGVAFPVEGVTASGNLGFNPRRLVDAFKENRSLTEAEARDRALLLERNLDNAIELVKLRHQERGDCLALLKKKGRLCVSFDSSEKCAGACRHDQAAACMENDAITLNLKLTGTNALPSHDPVMFWLVSTLLHAATHAAQDFTVATPPPDPDRRRAEENLKRVANELEAHTGGTNWSRDLVAMLDKTLRGEPLPVNSSPLLKRLYLDLNLLGPADRTSAAMALTHAALGGLRSDLRALAGYARARAALQGFLNASLSDPGARTATLHQLKSNLALSSWKTFVSHYEMPRLLSGGGESGILEQMDGPTSYFLTTGMRAIMDFDLSPDERTLVISGLGQVNNTASLHVYSDDNLNGIFEPFERMILYENNPQLSLNLSLARHPLNQTLLVYDQASQTLRQLLDANFDGKPDWLGPVVFETSESLQWVFRWYFDETGKTIRGFPFIDNRCPALAHDEVIAEAFDEEGDGAFEQFQFVTIGQVEAIGPTWLGQVTPGQTTLAVVGQLGNPILAFLLTPENVPGDLLGQVFHTAFTGDALPLSRPLTSDDRLILLDAGLIVFSPEFRAEVPPLRPRIVSASMAPNGFSLIWSSVPQRRYRVRFKSNLADPAWDFLSNPITASGTVTFQNDPEAPLASRRFYRVEQLAE